MKRLLFPAIVGLGLGAGISMAGHSSGGSAHAPADAGPERGARAATCGHEAATDVGDSAGATCLHLVYVWSPSMPLSARGIPEARMTATRAGLSLTTLSASELDRLRDDPATAPLRSRLLTAGATVHFPSLLLLRGAQVVGSAIVGYKRAEGYLAVLPQRLSMAATGSVAPPASLGTASTPRSAATTSAEQEIEVLWTHEVSPEPGAFFRRVPGTGFIAFDQRGRTYLRDLESGQQFRGPGALDLVPTPDGQFFVTPGQDSRSLEFYLASEIFERGRVGRAQEVRPFTTDRQMRDQYPSVGILQTDAQGRATRYRVLLSWFSGLTFRDYDVRWDEDGVDALVPVGPRLDGCPGMNLSIPMISKSGREVAARDEGSGTTKLFRIEDNGNCRMLFDLGRQTSKVGFGDDGTLIAYSSPDPSSARSGSRSITYVLDRTDMSTRQVPSSSSAGLVIPELVGVDSLLIAVKAESRSRSVEFRLLCCLR